MNHGYLDVKNTTKGKFVNLPFANFKNAILGKEYELSITFVTPSVMQRLNRIYRKKNKPTNVLSFSLSEKSGELLLCPSVIKGETKKFELSFRTLLAYLTIHGLLHLKGRAHGSTMEKAEKKFLKRFGFLK